MHSGGDFQQAVRAMVHSIHAGDVGQQGLGCADVGGGLVPPDVLLPGLHGHAQCWVPPSVLAHTCTIATSASRQRRRST